VLRAYVERYRWGIATPDDFLETAEETSGRDLDPLYNTWILSSQ
jgi:aminopeptidase N